MKLEKFEKWLDQIEKESDSQKLDKKEEEQLINLLHEKISTQQTSDINSYSRNEDEVIDVDKVLKSFEPGQVFESPKKGTMEATQSARPTPTVQMAAWRAQRTFPRAPRPAMSMTLPTGSFPCANMTARL